MAKRIWVNVNNILVIAEDTDITDDIRNTTSNIYTEINGSIYAFYKKSVDELILTIHYSDILDENGIAYESQTIFTDLIEKSTGNKEIDVKIQNQTTPSLITKFNRVTDSTILTTQATKFTYDIEVASTVGMIPLTSFLILFDVGSGRVYLGNIVSINVLTVTLDSQIDFEFPIGTIVDVTTTQMAVDGSITPVIFGIRGLGIVPGLNLEYDITRIIMTCYTSTAVSLAKFGDLTKLIRGVALRFRDGTVQNISNVKSNGEIAGITLDYIPYSATNPVQGQHGFTARLTFTGQDKLGVSKRLKSGEDLEFIIQDNLTGLASLEIVAEGHEVEL